MISAESSIPIDRRTTLSAAPAAARPSADNWRWVVDAGSNQPLTRAERLNQPLGLKASRPSIATLVRPLCGTFRPFAAMAVWSDLQVRYVELERTLAMKGKAPSLTAQYQRRSGVRPL